MAEINIYETTLNHNGEQGIIDFDVLLKAFQNAGITINVFNIWDNPSLMTEVRPVEQVLLQESVGDNAHYRCWRRNLEKGRLPGL